MESSRYQNQDILEQFNPKEVLTMLRPLLRPQKNEEINLFQKQIDYY